MDRTPFTITMRKDLLKKLDALVDGTKIRNRSHALEFVVSSHFLPKVKRALILAGGQGVRMRPFTYELPKTMLPVAGRPILEYIIELVRRQDVRELVISLGHLGEKIRDHFGDGHRFGVKITYLEEKKRLGTGGALKSALPLMGSEPFLLLWSDVLIDIDLGDLVAFHLEEMPLMTVALTSVSDPSEYGVVRLHRDLVVDFKEKPKLTRDLSHLVSAGVYVIDPKIARYLPDKEHFSLERDVMGRLIAERLLRGYLFEGKWFDVGTPQIYQRAITEWPRKSL